MLILMVLIMMTFNESMFLFYIKESHIICGEN